MVCRKTCIRIATFSSSVLRNVPPSIILTQLMIFRVHIWLNVGTTSLYLTNSTNFAKAINPLTSFPHNSVWACETCINSSFLPQKIFHKNFFTNRKGFWFGMFFVIISLLLLLRFVDINFGCLKIFSPLLYYKLRCLGVVISAILLSCHLYVNRKNCLAAEHKFKWCI